MRLDKGAKKRYILSLGLLSVLCLALFLLRIIMTQVSRYWFIPENLALAWLSFGFSLALVSELNRNRWLSWQNLSLSFLWLIFLPNSWYVLTDFVHVGPTGEISQIYDIILVFVLAVNGFALGFSGLFLLHREFLKRLPVRTSHIIVATILLMASFAVYLGRDLRWSTWDVVANPSGIILDVSDRVIDPFGHPRALNVTGLFFILLSVMYAAIWYVLKPQPEIKARR